MGDTDAHEAEPDPEAHILFVHVTTKVDICLVTEKNEVQEMRMVFDSLTDVLPKGTSLIPFCNDLKSYNLYLVRKQVKILVHYMRIT